MLLQTPVDVVLGDSPVLSRHHARILYNFVAKQWELLVEVRPQSCRAKMFDILLLFTQPAVVQRRPDACLMLKQWWRRRK
jgi:hypothetical protein